MRSGFGERLLGVGAVIVGAAALGACASIWGFQDAHDLDGDLVEAGADGDVAPPDPEVTPASIAGFVCVPAPPTAEWQSGLAIFETTSGSADLPPCPAGYATQTDLYAASTSPPLDCNCSCAPPTDACSPPEVTIYGGGNCAATPCASNVAVGTSCIPYPAACTTKGWPVEITQPAAANQAAKCAPSAAPAKPAPTFASRARTCAPAPGIAATCPAGKTPTPVASLAFGDYCIAQPGAQTCPPSYPVQKSYFTAFDDSRDCQCACGAPSGADCTTTVTAYDGAGCTGAMHAVSAACSNMIGMAFYLEAKRANANEGSCPATGGPVGSVSTENPTTICCRH